MPCRREVEEEKHPARMENTITIIAFGAKAKETSYDDNAR